MSATRDEQRARMLAELAATRLLAKSGQLSVVSRDEQARELEQDWQRWLTTLFPELFGSFAPHHCEFWDWIWELEQDVKPHPFVAIWPRHSGKSTAAEAASVAVGALEKRSYILYVSATQNQADDHVQNIASLLESDEVARYYPEMSNRRVGKYGTSRGWRRNRLRTASGVTIDAVGMDTAARGLKLEDARPDFIIVDDIDEEDDTRETTLKKIRRLTHALLPAGSHDAAEVFIQNLVLPDGIFARLANIASEQADFLQTRYVSGPHPALVDFDYVVHEGRVVITNGDPTWDDMGVEVCQGLIDTFGLDAFQSECQHLVRRPGTIVYHREWWPPYTDRRFNADDKAALSASCAARFLHLDTAQKDKDVNDYTTCAVVELTHDRRLRLRWMHRDRLEFPELSDSLIAWAEQWNDDGKLKQIVIEDKSSGTSLIQTTRRQAPRWMRRKLFSWQPRGSKEERARLSATWCRTGWFQLPNPGAHVPWLVDFEAELFSFPLSMYDDQVDAVSQSILYQEPWLEQGLRKQRNGA